MIKLSGRTRVTVSGSVNYPTLSDIKTMRQAIKHGHYKPKCSIYYERYLALSPWYNSKYKVRIIDLVEFDYFLKS